MERDQAKARGTALREYLQARLPVAGAQTVTSLARKAGVRPNTMTSWWTKGTVPDNATLELLAGALGVQLADLVEAYQGSGGRTWVFSDRELEALLERAAERGAERAVRRVLAEREPDRGV
ncbi:MAG: helix-turn-helix transcriptional regulator [Candidatus Limnocylindrales bacterium]|jgi:transcriptional regulator with XRE-family HTH domain